MKQSVLCLILGILITACIIAQEQFGKALRLDGHGDYMLVADHHSINFHENEDFTISLWLNTSVLKLGRIVYKVAWSIIKPRAMRSH